MERERQHHQHPDDTESPDSAADRATDPRTPSITVTGLGYIGLPTAAVLTESGFHVTGVDISPSTVAAVNAGASPIHEPRLQDVLRTAVASGHLSATDRVPPADVHIIAVPTPITNEKKADLTAVYEAADNLAPVLRPGDLVILESTSPPGTTARLAERILGARPDLQPSAGEAEVLFAHCPERVLPGRIMDEIRSNDRIIGGTTAQASRRARDIYARFCTSTIHLTDATTAEFVKLAENAYRDVNIAFANELAGLAEDAGIDPWDVIELANHHPRVNILRPGPGVGGHCIAVDPWFLAETAPHKSPLIMTGRRVNDRRPEEVFKTLAALLDSGTHSVAILGITFKADVEDIRSSPAIEIVQRLQAQFPTTELLIVEPNISSLPTSIDRPRTRLCSLPEALARADVVSILVDHREFMAISPEELRSAAVVDTRGILRRNHPSGHTPIVEHDAPESDG